MTITRADASWLDRLGWARCLVIALASVLLLRSSPVPAADPGEGGPDFRPLATRQLVVGGDWNYPPYEFLGPDGEPTGFDVELFRAVAHAMDLEVEFRLGPWSQVRRQLEAGELDAVVGMHYSVERDEFLDFSNPYALANYAVFVRSSEEGIQELSDLAGRQVLLQEASLAEDLAEGLGIAHTMIPVDGPEVALRMLAAGRYDAALLFKHQGLYLARALELDNVKVVGKPMAHRDYCFAVREGDEQLLTALNEGLAVVETTGRYQELQDRWFGVLSPSSWSLRRSLEVLGWVLVPTLALLLLSWLQAWILQRRVRQRTQQLLDELAERRRAESALAQERERLLATLRSIGDAVITTDREGRVELMNRLAESLLDQSLVEARGMSLAEVLPLMTHGHGLDVLEGVDELLSGRGAGRAVFEAQLATPPHPLVSVVVAPILDHDRQRQGVVVALRDITARRRMERELVRAEKLESVGVLAGGIAHDFNNLLTGVLGHVSLAQALLEEGHPVRSHLDKAEAATHRAQGLTKQLLTFSKGGVPVRRVLEVEPLVREAVELALAGSTARCELEVEPRLWTVEADSGQLVQVLHNLLLNADQAMPHGGTVRLWASNLQLDGSHPSGLEPGPYVRILLVDEGEGIPPELQGSIFEPFFTTKGDGSGLGLATAYSISTQHGGWLGLAEEQGPGASFEWLLPASPGVRPQAREPAPRLQEGSGRVLVMDDEAVVRDVLAAMLETMGYEATLVEDGEAAVEAYGRALEAGVRFDAVIMDLTVPAGMGGVEAMAAILQLDPRARGVVSSGFSDNPVMADPAHFGFSGVVSKPYRLATLSAVLAGVLEGASS
jgi:PAS domain S-box-containing protein